MKSRLFLLIFCGIGLSACRKDVADPHACFDPNVHQILVTNCTMSGCHNSKDKREGYDFTTYDGIMKGVVKGHALRSEIYNAIVSKGEERMPPDKALTNEEITIIRNWINLGANVNTCTIEDCDTTVFSYSKGVDPILGKYCRGCHGANSTNNVYLTDFGAVTNLINSGGRFIGSIRHTPGYVEMPQGLAKLSDCQIRVIEKWIAAGMPNN